MNALDQIGLGWQALSRSALQLGRRDLWLPWILLAIFQILFLAAFWWFAHPAVSWAMAPILVRMEGEDVLHYPNLFRDLPQLYSPFALVLAGSLGAVMAGASTLLFSDRFRRSELDVRRSFDEAFRKAGTLVVALLPVQLLSMACVYAVTRVLTSGRGSAIRGLALLVATLLIPAIVRALVFYLPALVVLEGKGAVSAFARLPETWRRGFWAAALLQMLLLIPMLPFHLLPQFGRFIVARSGPETMGWIMLAQISVGLLVAFLLAGSATLVYYGAVIDFDEWDPA